MTNLEKYTKAFVELFNIKEDDVVNLKYQDAPAWDSVGHMELMTAIEEAFGIMIEAEDIVTFSSFEQGKNILSSKYNIPF